MDGEKIKLSKCLKVNYEPDELEEIGDLDETDYSEELLEKELSESENGEE